MILRAARTLAALGLVPLSLAAAPVGRAVPVWHGGTIVALNANQSSNWGGYNQGALEKGTIFSSIKTKLDTVTVP